MPNQNDPAGKGEAVGRRFAGDGHGYSSSGEYPEAPGHRGVSTSVEAADMVAPFASRLRALVLRTLWRHPAGLTVDELCALVGFARYSLQSRFTELRHGGYIVDSGDRRPNVSGARAIVWTVAAEDRVSAA